MGAHGNLFNLAGELGCAAPLPALAEHRPLPASVPGQVLAFAPT